MIKRQVFLLLFLTILSCLQSKAQTFDLYIANDTPVDSVTYEFDVLIRSTTPTIWAFRTIQLSFLVNPNWLPNGPDPSITYIAGSSSIGNYTPGLMNMNASPGSLSAFQFFVNSAGVCNVSTQFTTYWQEERVGRFRIVSNAGVMNCVPNNLSFIRPTDPVPGTNVNLRVGVTKWSDPSCNPATSVTISSNGTYMNVAGDTLMSEYNNMAPIITVQPVDTVVRDCDSTQFIVSATPVVGQTATVTYQWYENGSIISNNAIFSGVNDDTLTITHPPVSMSGHTFQVVVSQCGIHHSDSVLLSVIHCNSGISETEDDVNISIFPNPTTGYINIRNLSDFKASHIEIVNSLSQVVYQADYKSKKGLTKELNLDLPKGVYFIRFYSADRNIQRSFVVQ